jgi:hypothetical protein
MDKKFEETTFGKFINRFSNTGEIGKMDHSIETKSILILGAVALATGILLFTINKYFFK